MKKTLSILLALMMVFTMTSVFAEATEAAEEAPVMEQREIEKGLVIYGSTTEVSGDFGRALWSNNASDAKIRRLTDDYYTVTSNQGGEYVMNPTVTESIDSVVNEDGTKTFTVKIQKDLVYNNGEAITAKDFVAPFLFATSKLATDLGISNTGYLTYVGGQAYYDGEATFVSGIRLLDDYTFSIQILAEKIPYYYDITYVMTHAMNLKFWFGDVDIADDGEGAYFTGAFNQEAVEPVITAARYESTNRVSAGPYNLVEFDASSKQATLEINPSYKGNFEGQKPSIERIIFIKAEDATWSDAIKLGHFNFYDTITDGSAVNTALDIIDEQGGFKYVEFNRPGFGAIFFQCDFGPTQFLPVRQAIIKLLNRTEFANTFTQGWGSVVNGPYGPGLWQYQEAKDWLEENLNPYEFNPEEAVELLVADGWVLNAEGGEYTEGIRYKKVTPEEAGNYELNITLEDGSILMPLEIQWSSSEGNAVSELLKVMLSEGQQTADAGMKINQHVMTFTELLNYYYRRAANGEQYAVPTYGMFNLALTFTAAYDQSYTFTLDPTLLATGSNVNFLLDEELDKLSMDMVYGIDPSDKAGYLDVWQRYIKRWNELVPDVPLYSNIWVTMFPDWLENYEQDSFWSFEQAILYATVAK